MTVTRRKRPEESTHDYQHALIEERVAAFHSAPKRSRIDKIRRREAYKNAVWTLDGHLRSQHGYRHSVGPPVGLDDLTGIHRDKHKVAPR